MWHVGMKDMESGRLWRETGLGACVGSTGGTDGAGVATFFNY